MAAEHGKSNISSKQRNPVCCAGERSRNSKIRLVCEMCGTGRRSEPLWYIKGKFYCSYCGMVKLVNSGSKEVRTGGFGGDNKEKTLKKLGGV